MNTPKSDIWSKIDDLIYRFRWPIGSVLFGLLLVGAGLWLVSGQNIQPQSAQIEEMVASPQQTKPLSININTADQALLETLPGIGPVKAKAIIDYRIKNGPFKRADDLIKVPGIGPKTLDGIRDQIQVE